MYLLIRPNILVPLVDLGYIPGRYKSDLVPRSTDGTGLCESRIVWVVVLVREGRGWCWLGREGGGVGYGGEGVVLVREGRGGGVG